MRMTASAATPATRGPLPRRLRAVGCSGAGAGTAGGRKTDPLGLGWRTAAPEPRSEPVSGRVVTGGAVTGGVVTGGVVTGGALTGGALTGGQS
jgi:hypothetical protein